MGARRDETTGRTIRCGARRSNSVHDAVAALAASPCRAPRLRVRARSPRRRRRQERDAERRRHAERTLLRVEAQALDGEADALGEAHGAGGVGALEHEQANSSPP